MIKNARISAPDVCPRPLRFPHTFSLYTSLMANVFHGICKAKGVYKRNDGRCEMKPV